MEAVKKGSFPSCVASDGSCLPLLDGCLVAGTFLAYSYGLQTRLSSGRYLPCTTYM